MSERPIRIVLVEDNEVYRSALELLLELQEGVEVVASVGDGRAAVEACIEVRADVVLMDFRLPGLDGAEATAALREACPETAVLCLTAEATTDERASVLAAGAAGLVEKAQPIEVLVAALRDAAGSRAA